MKTLGSESFCGRISNEGRKPLFMFNSKNGKLYSPTPKSLLLYLSLISFDFFHAGDSPCGLQLNWNA